MTGPQIVGIDIGLSGALAFRSIDDCLILDMPTLTLTRGSKNKREIDSHSLADSLRQLKPTHAFIEEVWSMPGQGVSSVFAFGKAYGIVLGTLATLQIPMTLVSPQKWKKSLRVPSDKDGARSRASELMPGWAYKWPLKKHDGRAEAALIAHYGFGEIIL